VTKLFRAAAALLVLAGSMAFLDAPARADGSTTLYRSTDRCEVVADFGVGLQGDGQGTIEVLEGPGPVVVAYLEWVGYDDLTPDVIPRGGDRADSELTVNGTVVVGIQPDGEAGYAPSGLPDDWYSWYADIGPTGMGLITDSSAMTLDVSGYDSPIDRYNNGASLVVVYDVSPCTATNLVEVRAGVDYYWEGLPDGGGFTLPITYEFEAADVDRTGQFFMNHAGTDSTQVECRGDALWLAAGTGTPPTAIVTNDGRFTAAYGINGGVEGLDDPFGGDGLPCVTEINPAPDVAPGADHPYPGGASEAPYRVAGFENTFSPEWTTIRVDVIIPAGATWLVFQIESESDQNGESGASAGGGPFMLTPTAGGEEQIPVDVELVKGVAVAAEGPFADSQVTTPGATVWWQVVVEAKSTDGTDPLGDVTGLVVSDVLPDGLTFVSAVGDGAYDAVTGLWTVGDLIAGTTATMLFETTVDVTGTIVNLAEVVAHDQPDIDSTPANGPQDPGEDDDDDAQIVSSLIDVDLRKLVDGEDGPVSRVAGNQITYTVVVGADDVTDDGLVLSDVTGLVVTDVLPSDVSFVSSSGDGLYDAATGQWLIGDLAAGATVRIDLVVTINSDAALEFVNVAEVVAHDQPDIDSTPGNGPQDPAEDDDDSVIVKLPQVSGEDDNPPDPGDTDGDIIPVTGSGSASLGFIGLLVLLAGLDLVLMAFSVDRLQIVGRRRS